MSQNFSASRSGKTVHISPDLMVEFITFDEQLECNRRRIAARKAIEAMLPKSTEMMMNGREVHRFETEELAMEFFVLFATFLPKAYA